MFLSSSHRNFFWLADWLDVTTLIADPRAEITFAGKKLRVTRIWMCLDHFVAALTSSAKDLFLGQWDMGQKLRRMGQSVVFCRYSGTAGQTGLNVIVTTIKCPTKVSHFWDERDSLRLVDLAGGNSSGSCFDSPNTL